jgi:hypothetical protein
MGRSMLRPYTFVRDHLSAAQKQKRRRGQRPGRRSDFHLGF